MQLSKSIFAQINNAEKPIDNSFDLPERILQFGTGVLLRGLCDYFIHKANQQGIFNGRIVVVKSTDAGDADEFAEQDNLYTVCIRGINEGKTIHENIICSSISRVISAKSQWEQVLENAQNPDIQVVISNTTEVGLQLVKESIHQQPPSSYPAKLLAFLHRRYNYFGGKENSGLIIIPTELITENGEKLQAIIKELAAFNNLDNAFLKWLDDEVIFCNSLVDRIVTKDPGKNILDELKEELGYDDKLLTMCEDYCLWAIQGNEKVASVLSFTKADPGVFVKPDIEIYKSLKLHLLNGTHTFSAPVACLSGFDYVKQGMADPVFFSFVKDLMLKEIGSAIPFKIPENEIQKFGAKVLDRFRNPFLQHQWMNITMQNTTKMRMRNVPVIKQFHESGSKPATCMSLGFAAYILFMRSVKQEGGSFFGEREGKFYKINDDHATYYYSLWQEHPDGKGIAEKVAGNESIWGANLSVYKEFTSLVQQYLEEMLKIGVYQTIAQNHKLGD
jgi:tagaturonate reductase